MDIAYIGIFIPIISIVGAFVMIIMLRKYENQERMNMIDKGINPNEFKLKKKQNTQGTLRFTMLMMGVGLGLFVGYFLDEATNMQEIAYFSMIFLFGGLGLGVSYLLEEKKNKDEDNIEQP